MSDVTVPTSEHSKSDASAVTREFERLTALAAQSAVRPVATGLAVLYAAFVVAHLALQPASLSRTLAPVAALSSLALAALARLANTPGRIRGHRALATVAGITLVNSLLHLALTLDPVQTTNLYLVVVGCGILLFLPRHLSAVVAMTTLGWTAAAIAEGFTNPLWVHFGVGLASAIALSLIVHWARNRFIHRVASLEVGGRSRELRLAASETRFRHLFNASPAMICTHDVHGIVTDVNTAGAEALGGTRDEIIGQRIDRFLVNGSRGVHRDYLETITRLGHAAGLARVRTLDGRERSWLYENTMLEDPDLDRYVLGTALDVTALQDARERLEAAQQDLEEQVGHRTAELRAVNARLEDELQERARMEARVLERHKLEGVVRLAGGVAHEFNNLLGIIRGNAELAALDSPPGAPALDYLKGIEEATTRGADLVDKVLSFSRPETRDHAPFPIASLLQESAGVLRHSFPENVTISVDVHDDVGNVVGNPQQIRQVLVELCDNARQAMPPEGGSVSIRASSRSSKGEAQTPGGEADTVRIEVLDSGCGIPARNLPRVFDPFFTTRDVGQGYGLGLSVAHGIVRAHGGEIHIESPASGGTRVVFFLPVAGAANDADVGSTPDNYILVVDDEPAIVGVARKFLERRGYSVLTASDGITALTLLRETPGTPLLLITDLSMPGMSGEDLVARARDHHPDLRVLVISGYVPEVEVDRFGGATLASVLSKPFRSGDLEAAIDAISPSAASWR